MSAQQDASHLDRVNSRKQAASRLGVSYKTLLRMEKRGDAPPRVWLTGRMVGYRDSAIEAFMKARTIA